MSKFCYKYIFLLIVGLSSACFFNFYTPAAGDLPSEELIGVWKPTDDSIAFLRKEKICCEDKEIKLILSANNNFEFVNVPDCWRNDFGECKGANFSYKGKWSIYQRNNSDNWLHLNEKDAVYSKTYAVPLIKRKGKIQIAIVFGDPDAGREIYLTKE